MSTEMVRRALAQRAEDVAGSAPDLAVLHARVAAKSRRRRVGAVAASVALVGAVAVAGAVLGRPIDTAPPEPAPAPSAPLRPTPAPSPGQGPGTPLPSRAETTEVQPTPYDRSAVERAHVLATLRARPGDPTLEWTVDRTADITYVQEFCRGATGTWLVVKGARGSSSATPCERDGGAGDAPMTTMPFVVDPGLVLPDIGKTLEAFVTTVDPTDANGPNEMRKGIPSTTTATVELAVWGQDVIPVAELLGRGLSALGVQEGRDWWFVHGIEAATGADSLTLELPASPVDRVVQTVTDYGRFDWNGPMPFVEISVDGRTVDHRTERPRIFFQDETSAFVPAGEPHTVVLEVTEGRSSDVDFAAAVFEAGDGP